MIDPYISEYFRQLAKRRRNPYGGFKHDPEAASRAGKMGAESRWHSEHAKKETPEEDSPEKGHNSQDDEPTPETPQWQ
jgi:hypothetical protein